MRELLSEAHIFACGFRKPSVFWRIVATIIFCRLFIVEIWSVILVTSLTVMQSTFVAWRHPLMFDFEDTFAARMVRLREEAQAQRSCDQRSCERNAEAQARNQRVAESRKVEPEAQDDDFFFN